MGFLMRTHAFSFTKGLRWTFSGGVCGNYKMKALHIKMKMGYGYPLQVFSNSEMTGPKIKTII